MIKKDKQYLNRWSFKMINDPIFKWFFKIGLLKY